MSGKFDLNVESALTDLEGILHAIDLVRMDGAVLPRLNEAECMPPPLKWMQFPLRIVERERHVGVRVGHLADPAGEAGHALPRVVFPRRLSALAASRSPFSSRS